MALDRRPQFLYLPSYLRLDRRFRSEMDKGFECEGLVGAEIFASGDVGDSPLSFVSFVFRGGLDSGLISLC